MARKRTLNYRDFRGDFNENESGGGEKEEREDEDEDEEEDDDEDGEEEASDEEDAGGGGDDDAGGGDDDDEDAPKKKKKKKVVEKKKPVKVTKPKKPRAGKVIRMRVVWGVFDNSNKRIAAYDYSKKADADAHAARMKEEKKQTYFVQPVKEPMEVAK